MNILNPADYPIVQSKDIAQVYAWFRKALFIENDLIEESDMEKHMIHFIRISNPRFYFKVFKPHLEGNNQSYYYLNYNPENFNPSPNTSFNATLDQLKHHFQVWISLLREYNAISFTEDDVLLANYEQEYKSYFTESDNSMDQPIEEQKQLQYYYALEGITNGLKKYDQQDSEIEKLIQATDDLKRNIQNITKSEFSAKLSKLLGKMKLKGTNISSRR